MVIICHAFNLFFYQQTNTLETFDYMFWDEMALINCDFISPMPS